MAKINTVLVHRHFVVLPLFLVLLSLSFWQGGNTFKSQTATITSIASNEGEIVNLKSGANALILSGEGFILEDEKISFLNGSALISFVGQLIVSSLDYNIISVNGSYTLSVYGNNLTVAAINVPVLIKKGEHMVLVPSGMQWNSLNDSFVSYEDNEKEWLTQREVKNIPHHFLKRQIANISKMKRQVPISNLPEARNTKPSSFVKTIYEYKLPVASLHALGLWRQDLFGYLRHLIDLKDIEGIKDILKNQEYSEVWSSSDGIDFKTQILSYTQNSAIKSILIKQLSEIEDIGLLLSIHPKYRNTVWILGEELNSLEAKLLQSFLLPISDGLPNAVSPLVHLRWAEATVDIFPKLSNPSGFVSTLITDTSKHILRLDEHGYPKRARDWTEAIRYITNSTELHLSSDAWESLEELEGMHSVDATLAVNFENKINETNKENEKNELEHHSPQGSAEQTVGAGEEVKAKADLILQEIGAIFLLDTKIKAISSNIVEVDRILFSTEEGDFLFSFVLNVSTGQISNISKDGKTYPYSLSKEAFMEWVIK